MRRSAEDLPSGVEDDDWNQSAPTPSALSSHLPPDPDEILQEEILSELLMADHPPETIEEEKQLISGLLFGGRAFVPALSDVFGHGTGGMGGLLRADLQAIDGFYFFLVYIYLFIFFYFLL